MKLRKVLAFLLSAALFLSLLAACGTSGDSGSNDVTTIIIGSGNDYKPYCYLDDDGNPVGYEYDVLAAIDEILTEYEFQYEALGFDNVTMSLDAGKVDVGAHQYEYSDERAEKYLFSDEAYTSYVTYITVPADNTTINSLDDLQGKTVNAPGTTSASNAILQAYNEEHPDNPIIIVNAEGLTNEQKVTNLVNGVWDAAIEASRDVDDINEEFDNALKIVGEPVNDSKTYYLFNKENTELKERFDEALKELKESGKLAEISVEWLGADFTGD